MGDFISNNIWVIVITVNYLLVILAAFTVLTKNLNPTKTISYIIVLVFFPFFGLVVYYLFGQEYRKNKIFNRKHILNQKLIADVSKRLKPDKQEITDLEHDLLNEKIKLVKLLHSSPNAPLTTFNDVKIIKNGEHKFKILLEDLKKATMHIHMEYYILRDDKIGTKIIDILCDKAKEGVKVRLSIDDVGSSVSRKNKNRMEESGVEWHPFMPVLFPGFTGKMNYRNHRKIVVIDGQIGYIGGINVSDTYVNYEGTPHYWRDTHLRIVGESVKSLQIHFLMNWEFVSGRNIKIEESFFPKEDCKESVAMQIAASGPDTDWANIMEVIFTAIVTSENYVFLTTPYFIPNDQIITALQVASKSGVDVRLLIPKESDSWTAKHATNSYIECLLEANIKIYRYRKGFIHAKTIVIDDVFCTVGTTNIDYRSFNINFEINAIIYNTDKSLELKSHFFEDLEDSELIDQERWMNRPRIEKFKESYCRLWAPLL
ncbi:cardiolipin synthase [Gelidibacter algens]|uniref:Cardiolipin synthase n=1 Tax=Gelidibacter algens TaxID=49280 RepID=A0A1A7R1E5_9FLAO|nr:cardiolipin synthase [Gelidibacter algens]OBX24597.1 cardiolipin synthase [Gelidibacter algens]RAJ27798.1 cardiolipin synthase [Gelidibacter algens]